MICPACDRADQLSVTMQTHDLHVKSRKSTTVVILRVQEPTYNCKCGLCFTDYVGETIRDSAANVFWWFEENVAEVHAIERECDRDKQ